MRYIHCRHVEQMYFDLDSDWQEGFQGNGEGRYDDTLEGVRW